MMERAMVPRQGTETRTRYAERMTRLLLSLAFLLLSGAGAQSIQGVTWTLTRIGNLSEPTSTMEVERDDAPTLRLENGRASGFAGCNTFTGTYSLRGRDLGLSALVSTKKACETNVRTILESRYLRDLERINTATLSGSVLVLTTDDGTILAFRRAP